LLSQTAGRICGRRDVRPFRFGQRTLCLPQRTARRSRRAMGRVL